MNIIIILIFYEAIQQKYENREKKSIICSLKSRYNINRYKYNTYRPAHESIT